MSSSKSRLLWIRPRRLPEVLENEHVFEPWIGGVQLGHALLIDGEQVGQVCLTHLVQGDAVARIVDHDLVAAVTVDDLLQTEGDVGLGAVVAEYRVQIGDDADIPVLVIRIGLDLRRCPVLVAVRRASRPTSVACRVPWRPVRTRSVRWG